MNNAATPHIFATEYDRSACQVGVVHLGFGAFHRAHQAVYIDDYMACTNDLRWGIAAVNLRGSESVHFDAAVADRAAAVIVQCACVRANLLSDLNAVT